MNDPAADTIIEVAYPGRENLWLVKPMPGIHQLVWDVVCLSAIAALEAGRRYLYANRDSANLQETMRVGATKVVAEFWAALHSYASADLPPKGWDEVPLAHPFLQRTIGGDVEAVRRRGAGPIDGLEIFAEDASEPD